MAIDDINNADIVEDTTYEETMLTTIDNPFNPFTDYEKWTMFDEVKGYNTAAYLARCVNIEEDAIEAEVSLAIDEATEQILYFNLTGKYCKIKRNGEFVLNE